MEVALTAGGTKRITAKQILLAVGGRAVKAPIEGAVSSGPGRLSTAQTCVLSTSPNHQPLRLWSVSVYRLR